MNACGKYLLDPLSKSLAAFVPSGGSGLGGRVNREGLALLSKEMEGERAAPPPPLMTWILDRGGGGNLKSPEAAGGEESNDIHSVTLDKRDLSSLLISISFSC